MSIALHPNFTAATPLMRAFLSNRGTLRRLFAVRLRSFEAAEDIVQDMAVRISEIELGCNLNVTDTGAFLYRMGCNLITDRARSRQRSTAREEAWSGPDVRTTVPPPPTPEQLIAALQKARRVINILKAQPLETREAFRLHRLEGRTLADTAISMGLTASQVERRAKAAMEALVKGMN